MTKLLKSAEAIFQKRGMYVENPDKACIAVSNSMDELPFLYLIDNKDEFNGFIISLAVDYINTYEILDITLSLLNISPMALGEKFYINPNGDTYWGEEAEHAFILDNLKVENMEGPSKLWN